MPIERGNVQGYDVIEDGTSTEFWEAGGDYVFQFPTRLVPDENAASHLITLYKDAIHRGRREGREMLQAEFNNLLGNSK